MGRRGRHPPSVLHALHEPGARPVCDFTLTGLAPRANCPERGADYEPSRIDPLALIATEPGRAPPPLKTRVFGFIAILVFAQVAALAMTRSLLPIISWFALRR
jgi:hypothetical protein